MTVYYAQIIYVGTFTSVPSGGLSDYLYVQGSDGNAYYISPPAAQWDEYDSSHGTYYFEFKLGTVTSTPQNLQIIESFTGPDGESETYPEWIADQLPDGVTPAGSSPPPPPANPNIAFTQANLNTSSVAAGGSIGLNFSLKNTGGSVGNTTVVAVLSQDGAVDSASIPLGTSDFTIPPLAANGIYSLPANTSDTIPSNTPPGQYDVIEIETDGAAASTAVATQPLTVTGGQLFTAGNDTVDFAGLNSPAGLTTAQVQAMNAGADLYHADGGSDKVWLPISTDGSNYPFVTQSGAPAINSSIKWDPTQTFVIGSSSDTAATVDTVTAGNGSKANKGSYNIDVSGSATVTLNINTSGNTTIYGGFGADTLNLTSGGGSNTYYFVPAGRTTLGGNIALNNGASLTFNSTPTTGTFSGTLSGSGSLTTVGGTVTLKNGNSGFSGPTTISTGTLELGNVTAAGSGSITFGPVQSSGATLPGETLKIDGATMPTNVIKGFAVGDTIDLANVSYNLGAGGETGGVAVLGAKNVLTVTVGGTSNRTSYTLNFDPNQDFNFSPSQAFPGQTFELSSDGNGGTDITLANNPSLQDYFEFADLPYALTYGYGTVGFGEATNPVLTDQNDINAINWIPDFTWLDSEPYTQTSETGLNAMTFVDLDPDSVDYKDVVVAFRGSVTLYDWFTEDRQLGLTGTTPADFPAAVSLVLDDLLSKYSPSQGYSYFVTGHSLGAAIAEDVASVYGFGGDTFAAPGVSKILSPDGVASNGANLTDYLVSDDPVANDASTSFLSPNGDHLGTPVILPPILFTSDQFLNGRLYLSNWGTLITSLQPHKMESYGLQLAKMFPAIFKDPLPISLPSSTSQAQTVVTQSDFAASPDEGVFEDLQEADPDITNVTTSTDASGNATESGNVTATTSAGTAQATISETVTVAGYTSFSVTITSGSETASQVADISSAGDNITSDQIILNGVDVSTPLSDPMDLNVAPDGSILIGELSSTPGDEITVDGLANGNDEISSGGDSSTPEEQVADLATQGLTDDALSLSDTNGVVDVAATVGAGGTLTIMGGASAAGTVVGNGGKELVSAGGIAGGTVQNGGVLELLGGAALGGITAQPGGMVEAGPGYNYSVSSGQTASNIGVVSGGTMTVSSGGGIGGTTVINGGTLVLNAGASGGVVNFQKGGMLDIGGTSVPSGLSITGFTFGDTIDLTGATFAAGGLANTNPSNALTVTESGRTFTLNLDPTQQFLGDQFTLAKDSSGGTDITLSIAQAHMISRNTATGQIELYNIANNQIASAFSLGQVGLDWSVAGIGDFSGNVDEIDMLTRNMNSGAFELYDINNNQYSGFYPLGQVGTAWAVEGFGNFSSKPNETDMLTRNTATGAFELYDISNNTYTGFYSLGQVGPDWSVVGFGDFSGNANETDMLMRNTAGTFEIYDIANSQIYNAHGMGQVGPEWSVVGFGDFSGNANETDMMMRSTAGAFELYDISNNQISAMYGMGQVGPAWQVAGFGDFSGNANETDMLMRNTSSGAFEFYDISKNAYGTVGSMGQVGPVWNVSGLMIDPAAGTLATAMAPSPIVDGPVSAGIGISTVITQSLLQFSDNFSSDAQETYAITGGPSHGVVLRSGIAVTSFTQGDIDSGLIAYQSAGVFTSDAFSFTVTDAAGNTTAPETLQINLSDKSAPALTHDGPVTAVDGISTAITSNLLQFDDNVSTHAQETYTITAGPSHGTVLKNGTAVTSFTQAEIDNGAISYKENGAIAASDSLSFTVTDAAGNATAVKSLQFNLVVLPPTVTHDVAVNVGIGRTVAITSSLLQFDDNVSSHAQETYTITAAPADGTILKNGATVTTFTQADIDNGLITYQENGSIASSDSFSFTVTDAAGKATATQQLSIQITPPAELFMRDTANGAIELYGITNNQYTGFYSLGQVGLEWTIVGIGDFSGNANENDMLMQNTSTGAFQLFDISNYQYTGFPALGQVGQPWQVAGFGDFSGNANETDMLMRNASTGAFELFDIAKNQMTGPSALAQVGPEWAVVGFGDFSGVVGEDDMMMRNSTTGAFELYDISKGQITASAALGQVGPEWAVAGLGDFSSNANETDMLMRNSNTGAFELYDISNNQFTAFFSLGQVGPEWQVAGFGDFSGNTNETDMLMRSSTTGAFEIYDIGSNAYTAFQSMGQVGPEWQVSKIAVDMPSSTGALTTQFAQAMSSFGPAGSAAATGTNQTPDQQNSQLSPMLITHPAA